MYDQKNLAMRRNSLLLVEDELLVGLSEKQELENRGFQVRLVQSAQEAIHAVLEDQSLDLVLMDVNLGKGINGIQTSQLILKEVDIPIIILSNSYPASTENINQLEQVHLYGFVQKSADTNTLVLSIEIALNAFRRKHKTLSPAITIPEFANTLSDMLYVMDENLNYTFWNEASERFLSIKSEKIIGRNILDVFGDFGKEPAIFYREVIQTRKQQTKVFSLFDDRGSFFIEVTAYPISGGVVAIARDVTERAKNERRMRSLIQQKEILLHEVYHRIKNNLVTIRGVMSLHLNYLHDETAINIVNDIRDRLNSMLTFYDQLSYREGDQRQISVSQYVYKLMDSLNEIYNRDKSITVFKEIQDIYLNYDQLFTLGLLINEIVTNSFKHAFGGISEPSLTIRIVQSTLKPGTIELMIEDNGKGIAITGDSDTFGLFLIQTLVSQLKGSSSLENTKGTSYQITFPAE